MQNYSRENCYNVEDPYFTWSKSNHDFQQVGLQYGRPLFYKNTKPESFKRYILLFIYLFTRTVHLEITLNVRSYSLKIESHRFFSWIGIGKLMISDKPWTERIFMEYVMQEFISVQSPWSGGFYEHLVATECQMFEKVQRKIKYSPTTKLK